MWAELCVKASGHKLQVTMVLDNSRTMKLMKTGKASGTKQTKNQYQMLFKDYLDEMEFESEFCSTDKLLTDSMNKPLQCKKFLDNNNSVMGVR